MFLMWLVSYCFWQFLRTFLSIGQTRKISPWKKKVKYLICKILDLIYVLFINYVFADIYEYFIRIIQEQEELSAGMAAIRTLLEVLERSKCKQF